MSCDCGSPSFHNYDCRATPKCGTCKTRLDYKPCHNYNCPNAVLCEHCGVNLQDPEKYHNLFCPTHFRCEFCGITENIRGSVHNYGCPKWNTEYNQRRIRIIHENITSRHFNLDNFRFANFNHNQPLIQPPNMNHLGVKSEEECPICYKNNADCKTKCGHYFHMKCLGEWNKISMNCPICRSHFFF